MLNNKKYSYSASIFLLKLTPYKCFSLVHFSERNMTIATSMTTTSMTISSMTTTSTTISKMTPPSVTTASMTISSMGTAPNGTLNVGSTGVTPQPPWHLEAIKPRPPPTSEYLEVDNDVISVTIGVCEIVLVICAVVVLCIADSRHLARDFRRMRGNIRMAFGRFLPAERNQVNPL